MFPFKNPAYFNNKGCFCFQTADYLSQLLSVLCPSAALLIKYGCSKSVFMVSDVDELSLSPQVANSSMGWAQCTVEVQPR